MAENFLRRMFGAINQSLFRQKTPALTPPYTVSSEGGPLLIGCPRILRHWRGVESDHYDKLCSAWSNEDWLRIPLEGGEAIALEFGGPGTVDILPQTDGVKLVRIWPGDSFKDEDVEKIAALPFAEDKLHTVARLALPAGVLVVVWAPESLEGLTEPENLGTPAVPKLKFSMDGTALLVPLDRGEYEVIREKGETEWEGSQAIRVIVRKC